MYSVFLDEIKIGTTKLEHQDSSMGVVFGVIDFIEEDFNYDLIKGYCLNNNVEIIFDDYNEKLITTSNISSLRVFNNVGIEITNKKGCNFEGMDKEGFQITILEIPSSFFEKDYI